MTDIQFFGNPLRSHGLAIACFLSSLLALTVLKRILMKRLKALAQKSQTPLDDFALGLFEKTLLPLFYFGALYFSLNLLILSPGFERLLTTAGLLVVSFQGTRFLIAVLVFGLEEIWFKKKATGQSAVASKSIITILRIVVWGGGLVFVLDNLGFNVATVLAGLGIGGVAVALAAQTILGDIFNYFVIFFDRPFQEGDFIVTGAESGTIEHIGIKSTRLRSVSGEQLVISNSNLMQSRIRNYKRMERRYITFAFQVVYDTPTETLKKIPFVIEKIFAEVPHTKLDRANFTSFGERGLIFEVAYFVLSADYNQYMQAQQKINLALKEGLDREGVEFAKQLAAASANVQK